MRLQKITIDGMHKVEHAEYTFNDKVTYFVGPNGVGKSTILEAIQLALLGYIPGYAKTNESVVKHSPKDNLSITLLLDTGAEVTRSWKRTGSSVKSECSIKGYPVNTSSEETIKSLISEIELPVFDFNEFRSMTANKLKDWFITFLPSHDDDLDIEVKLKDSLGQRQLPTEDLLKRVNSWVAESDVTGLELVRLVNAKLKEEQSFVKGQISKLQGTIESLIRYDDVPDEDEDEISEAIAALNAEKNEIMQANAQKANQEKIQALVDAAKSNLQADSFEEDPRVPELRAKIDSLFQQSQEAQKIYSELQKQQLELENQLRRVPSAASICPYTNEHCDTAANLADKFTKEAQDLQGKVEAARLETSAHNPSTWYQIDMDYQNAQKELANIELAYNQVDAYVSKLTPESESKDLRTLEEVDADIREKQDILIKLSANKRYDELTTTVTTDKFALENDLEILKVWIKYTDANGLQTELMEKPFVDLAEEMSKYLSQMFDSPVSAQFNLSTKANSFSFGLIRDSKYIEFDYLSSGEKCLFTLALIMCILDQSNSQVRTILIDDILDHLDEPNATHLFKSLQSVDNIQFILAGVKECKDQGICKAV